MTRAHASRGALDRCPHCGYDLTATPAERPCPECGHHSPRLHLATFANLPPDTLRALRRMLNLLALATTLDVLALTTLLLTGNHLLTAAPAIVAIVVRLVVEATMDALRPLISPFRRAARPGFLVASFLIMDGGAIALFIASMWINREPRLFWMLVFPMLTIIRMLIITDVHASVGPYSTQQRCRATARSSGTWTSILGWGTIIAMVFCVGYAIAIVTIPLLLAFQLATASMICRDIGRQLATRPPETTTR